jgi:transcriptional regulator GlxA family with amidase domain
MASSRRIVFLVYPGFELLDLSGPAAVFSTFNALRSTAFYELVVASPRGGSVASNFGMAVSSVNCRRIAFGPADTVLAMGAYGRRLVAAMRSTVIARTLGAAALHAERIGSVCTGAFVLGAAGLLVGKRVATHWAGAARLAAAYAHARVAAEALFVVDGRLWTSAGISTGIDMALAMLERDHGTRLMGRVARQLVVYACRPGHQSQFSAAPEARVAADRTFARLADWLEARLGDPITVGDMAARAGMSERTFHRRFSAATGVTPSKFLDGLRLERAKRLLETRQPVKAVAPQVGFQSESAFRSAFAARFGITPTHHARMHARPGPR